MKRNDRKSDFITLFIDSVKLDYEQGGIRRIVPYFLGICLCIGFLISFLVTENKQPNDLVLLVSAMITAQGIILAMNMQTCGAILNSIHQGDFTIFLREHKLLNYYMLIVQFMQIIHIISLCCLVAAAISLKVDLFMGTPVFRNIFGVAFGFFLYALRWTFGASTVIRDLLYWKGEFEYNRKVNEALAKTPHPHYD